MPPADATRGENAAAGNDGAERNRFAVESSDEDEELIAPGVGLFAEACDDDRAVPCSALMDGDCAGELLTWDVPVSVAGINVAPTLVAFINGGFMRAAAAGFIILSAEKKTSVYWEELKFRIQAQFYKSASIMKRDRLLRITSA